MRARLAAGPRFSRELETVESRNQVYKQESALLRRCTKKLNRKILTQGSSVYPDRQVYVYSTAILLAD